jgi:uncharacterized protein (TIGR02145 family)
MILSASIVQSQIRIFNDASANKTAINSSAFIDASSDPTANTSSNVGKGLLYPRTDLTNFTAFGGTPMGIPNSYPTLYDGMIVYNTANGGVAGIGSTEGTLCYGFWYYQNPTTNINGGIWRPLRPCSTFSPPGTITALNCGTVVNNGTLTAGTLASGVSSVYTYTGGNGGAYNAQSILSTGGVLGLTAELAAGNFANGTGTLTYTITGTPSGSGTASFAINIGGQTCTLSRTVNSTIGTITSLDCAGTIYTGTLTAGIPASSGVTMVLPYTGGNGGSYSGQTIASGNQVTGLTATLASGNFANGSGTLTFTVTGTPSNSGSATWAVIIDGKACFIGFNVGAAAALCGANIAPGVYKEFMCYNLGADTSLDPFTPAAGLHGAKYQWGNVVPVLTQAQDQANSGPITGWNSTPVPDGSWSDTSKTANDPCPAGYRVPTSAQWQGVIDNNVLTMVGTFSTVPSYTSAMKFGSDLMLPFTDIRNSFDGAASNGQGGWGRYWSSSYSTGARNLTFINTPNNTPNAFMSNLATTHGLSIRCISE